MKRYNLRCNYYNLFFFIPELVSACAGRRITATSSCVSNLAEYACKPKPLFPGELARFRDISNLLLSERKQKSYTQQQGLLNYSNSPVRISSFYLRMHVSWSWVGAKLKIKSQNVRECFLLCMTDSKDRRRSGGETWGDAAKERSARRSPDRNREIPKWNKEVPAFSSSSLSSYTVPALLILKWKPLWLV